MNSIGNYFWFVFFSDPRYSLTSHCRNALWQSVMTGRLFILLIPYRVKATVPFVTLSEFALSGRDIHTHLRNWNGGFSIKVNGSTANVSFIAKPDAFNSISKPLLVHNTAFVSLVPVCHYWLHTQCTVRFDFYIPTSFHLERFFRSVTNLHWFIVFGPVPISSGDIAS